MNVLELLDRLLAHVLELANVVVDRGDVDLAGGPSAAGRDHETLGDRVADLELPAVRGSTQRSGIRKVRVREEWNARKIPSSTLFWGDDRATSVSKYEADDTLPSLSCVLLSRFLTCCLGLAWRGQGGGKEASGPREWPRCCLSHGSRAAQRDPSDDRGGGEKSGVEEGGSK